jgi:hypothetical protein
MEIEVYQTIKEKDGTLSAYVSFKDEVSGKYLKRICIQGKEQVDFEPAIKKAMEALDAEIATEQTDKTTIQAAIDKVVSEKEKE